MHRLSATKRADRSSISGQPIVRSKGHVLGDKGTLQWFCFSISAIFRLLTNMIYNGKSGKETNGGPKSGIEMFRCKIETRFNWNRQKTN